MHHPLKRFWICWYTAIYIIWLVCGRDLSRGDRSIFVAAYPGNREVILWIFYSRYIAHIVRHRIAHMIMPGICVIRHDAWIQQRVCLRTVTHYVAAGPAWRSPSAGLAEGIASWVRTAFRKKYSNTFNCFQSGPFKGPAWLGAVSRDAFYHSNGAISAARVR